MGDGRKKEKGRITKTEILRAKEARRKTKKKRMRRKKRWTQGDPGRC